MQASNEDTAMIHWECHTCGMAATCVLTSSATLAWLDHMENHALADNYSAWTWTVQKLPL